MKFDCHVLFVEQAVKFQKQRCIHSFSPILCISQHNPKAHTKINDTARFGVLINANLSEVSFIAIIGAFHFGGTGLS